MSHVRKGYKQTQEHVNSRKRFGADHYNWKGGRIKHGKYYAVRLHPDDFFYPMMARSGYVLEHRLVMAKHLGRLLQRWEIIHHLNGDKLDNRIENLQIVTDERHTQITLLENRIRTLEQRVTLLEAENALLRGEYEQSDISQR